MFREICFRDVGADPSVANRQVVSQQLVTKKMFGKGNVEGEIISLQASEKVIVCWLFFFERTVLVDANILKDYPRFVY